MGFNSGFKGLNQSMCILLGHASPCDCISLWWRQCRCYAQRNSIL